MELEEVQVTSAPPERPPPQRRRPGRKTFGQNFATILATPTTIRGEIDTIKAQPIKKFKAMLVEFSGTGVFVLFGGLSLHNRNGGVIDKADIVSIALAHGLTIAILISAAGHISGGHFNPVVSLAVYLAGSAGFLQMISYWAAQILGGYLGGFLIRACVNKESYISFAGGTLNMSPAFTSVGPAVVLEIAMTFFLVMTVLMVAVDPLVPNVWAPWAIGLSITVDVFAGGTVTGACMNPARCFGPLAAYGSMYRTLNCTEYQLSVGAREGFSCTPVEVMWHTHWIDWVGPFGGSILAVIMYRLLFAAPHKNWVDREL